MSDRFTNPALTKVTVTNNNLGGYIGITTGVLLSQGASHEYKGVTGLADLKAAFDAVGGKLPGWEASGAIAIDEVLSTNQVAGADTGLLKLKQKTVTVGMVGVTGCDFNYVTAGNTTAQPLDLGALIPAQAIVLGSRAKNADSLDGAAYNTAAITQTADLIVTKGISFNLNVTSVASNVTTINHISKPFNSTQLQTATDIAAAITATAGILSCTLSGSNRVYTIVATEGYTISVTKLKVVDDYTAISVAYTIPIKGYTVTTLTQAANVIAGKTIALKVNVTSLATGVTVASAVSQVFSADQTTTAAALAATIALLSNIASCVVSGSDLIYTITASPGYTVSVTAITVTGAYTTFTNVASVPANVVNFTLGITSGGNTLGASTALSVANSFVGLAPAGAPAAALSSSPTHVWLGATPAAVNWANIVKGKIDVSIIYAEFDN